MKPNQITQINDAVFVLRHFIELSAKLLPFLQELQLKRNPTIDEIVNRKKIIGVYKNYDFDTRTSEMLLDSNILELIRDSFNTLIDQESRIKKHKALQRFINEHKRLENNWQIIRSN